MHKKRHTNILTKATSLWKQTYGSQWYTNTYYAQTPQEWAKQVLGNTFSIQSSKHIIRALDKSNMKTPITPNIPKALTLPLDLTGLCRVECSFWFPVMNIIMHQ